MAELNVTQETPVPLKTTLMPSRVASHSCITLPVEATTFTVRPNVIQILPTFHGAESEHPYLHIKDFENASSTYLDGKVSSEAVHLKRFPFTLKDKAKSWFNALPPNSITTWLQLQTEFKKKIFSIHMTHALKKQIMSFAQKEHERYDQAWERYKDLLQACPHHGYDQSRQVGFFYDGLLHATRQYIEMMCNGEFLRENSS